MYYVNVADNVKVAVYDLNPNAKKTIFLVHGWPLSHKMYEYQVNMLIKEGYRVVSIDLRGFGNSDTTATGYDYNTLATDVYKVIRTLKLKNLILVGFSMGGAIVTRYMALYRGYNVKKLCLIGAAVPSYTKRIYNPKGSTIEQVNDLIRQAQTNRPQLNENFGNMLFASNPTRALKNWFLDMSNSTSGVGEIATAISLRDESLMEDIRQIQVPTGIFHGKLDEVCPFDFAIIQHQNIKNSKLFPFERSGHAVFYDELEKFNREFLSYIEQ